MIGRKPDLVCIGTQKAATSWFHAAMTRRRDVWAAPFKEVHFFDHKFLPEHRRWIEDTLVTGVRRCRDRHLENQSRPDQTYLEYLDDLLVPPAHNGTWYKKVFSRAHPDQTCLDVTPEYCTLPEDGVDFVAKFLRDSQFIWIIRDPVDRALSQLRMVLDRDWDAPPKGLAGWHRFVDNQPLMQRGDYATYVPRWQARFDDRRLLFLPYGQVATDPAGVIRQVEDFANLDRVPTPGLTDRVHGSTAVDIPPDIHARITDMMAPQRAFLEQRFGAEFTSQT